MVEPSRWHCHPVATEERFTQVHTIVAAVILASITGSSGGDISSKAQLGKIVVMGVVACISFMLTVRHTLNSTDIVYKA